MKARMIYLAMLMMSMFVMSACSNEDDFSDIMDSNNLLTKDIEIFEVERENTTVSCPDKEYHTASLFNCYENKSELNGLYTIDDMDLLNWNNRTLVMVDVFYHSSIIDFTKKVYEKDGKYVIEFLEIETDGYRFQAFDHRCFGILLDKSDVKKEDIQLKVGIQYFNEKGERYYKFI